VGEASSTIGLFIWLQIRSMIARPSLDRVVPRRSLSRLEGSNNVTVRRVVIRKEQG